MNEQEKENITIFGNDGDDLEIYAGTIEDGGDTLTYVINQVEDGNPDLDAICNVEDILRFCRQHNKVMFFVADKNPQEAIEDVSEFFVWLVKGGADLLLR